MDRFRQKISKATEIVKDTIEQLELIDIFRRLHSSPAKKNQNTHSFQVHIEHSLGLTTYYGTKQASTNLRVQKLFQASFMTTKAWN